MRYELFKEVVLKNDIPEENLKKGDVATILEYHPVSRGEDGYSLEVFMEAAKINTKIRLIEQGA